MQQIQQHILIADSLIAQYRSVVARFIQAWKDNDDSEMSVLRAEIERVYTGIWEQLDDAAKKTQAAGRPVETYRAIRTAPGLVVGAAIGDVSERVVGIDHGITKTTVTSRLTIHQNGEGLETARQAADALRALWPELDFTPAPDPVVDLKPRGFLSRLFGR